MTTTIPSAAAPSASTSGANNLSAASQQVLTPANFMTLLLKQLTTQDPSKPMDSNQMLQQMSEMRSIQASQDMQDTLTSVQKGISTDLGRSQFFGATQLVGKLVEVPSTAAPLVQDSGLNGSVSLSGPASDIKVTITDPATKAVVAVVDAGASQSAGLADFHWDGMQTDANGAPLVDGQGVKIPATSGKLYNISAAATINGVQSAVDPRMMVGAFPVKSVGLDRSTGTAVINVDQLGGISVDDIIKIL